MKSIRIVELSQQLIVIVALVVLNLTTIVLSGTTDDSELLCDYNQEQLTLRGVCIDFKTEKVKYCPRIRELAISEAESHRRQLRRNFCTRRIKNGQVCCPLEGEGSYEEDTKYYGIDESKPEEDYTRHKNWHIFDKVFQHDKCGQTHSGQRIVGGSNAGVGDFPWMARIGYVLDDNSTFFDCSGSIISDRYILTAAHCLNKWLKGAELAPIRLAELDDSFDPEYSSEGDVVFYQDFPIEEVYIHPNYEAKSTSFNDIALVRLAKRIENIAKNTFIKPICLPFVKEYGVGNQLDETIFVSERHRNDFRVFGMVAGWGKVVNEVNEGSTILQYLKVPFVPSIECRILYGKHKFSSQQLCVGGEQNKSSCWGDSGGPLFIAPKTQARYYVIGIVSYGASECGLKGIPHVYTRVRDYLKWILDTVRD